MATFACNVSDDPNTLETFAKYRAIERAYDFARDYYLKKLKLDINNPSVQGVSQPLDTTGLCTSLGDFLIDPRCAVDLAKVILRMIGIEVNVIPPNTNNTKCVDPCISICLAEALIQTSTECQGLEPSQSILASIGLSNDNNETTARQNLRNWVENCRSCAGCTVGVQPPESNRVSVDFTNYAGSRTYPNNCCQVTPQQTPNPINETLRNLFCSNCCDEPPPPPPDIECEISVCCPAFKVLVLTLMYFPGGLYQQLEHFTAWFEAHKDDYLECLCVDLEPCPPTPNGGDSILKLPKTKTAKVAGASAKVAMPKDTKMPAQKALSPEATPQIRATNRRNRAKGQWQTVVTFSGATGKSYLVFGTNTDNTDPRELLADSSEPLAESETPVVEMSLGQLKGYKYLIGLVLDANDNASNLSNVVAL